MVSDPPDRKKAESPLLNRVIWDTTLSNTRVSDAGDRAPRSDARTG
jgi:hypothetical protein